MFEGCNPTYCGLEWSTLFIHFVCRSINMLGEGGLSLLWLSAALLTLMRLVANFANTK